MPNLELLPDSPGEAKLEPETITTNSEADQPAELAPPRFEDTDYYPGRPSQIEAFPAVDRPPTNGGEPTLSRREATTEVPGHPEADEIQRRVQERIDQLEAKIKDYETVVAGLMARITAIEELALKDSERVLGAENGQIAQLTERFGHHADQLESSHRRLEKSREELAGCVEDLRVTVDFARGNELPSFGQEQLAA